jgi:nicotinamide phosphoribosyltransferase
MKNATKRKKENGLTKDVSKYIAVFDSPKSIVKTGCMSENLLLLSDSYKESHWSMLPEGTQKVYSYFESRKGATFPYTVFFGLQFILKKYLAGVVITQNDIEYADTFCKEHFGMDIFNRRMWEKIVNVYGGKLPIKIKAVPEGLPISVSNVMMTVENTDDDCAPLTNFVETLLTHIWYSSNVATISRDIKVYLKRAFDASSDNLGKIPFMLHDFGFRGVSSVESAGSGGAGHLVNFMGTDTIIAITYAQRYYGAKMAGFSVPATEHSVMTAKGEEGELEIWREVIRQFPKGILSIVADSYNIERVIKEYLPALKAEIMARDGTIVIRPDSPRSKDDSAAAQVLWLANSLGGIFGYKFNNKGYMVLEPHIGLIYGDGLSVDEIKECIKTLVLAGWSAETCVYGMGGGLLQKHNRDTQRSAFKCSAQKRAGKWINISKKPLDPTKVSKAGRLKLVWNEGASGKTLITVQESDPRPDVLVTVFENGKITKEYNWEEVRANAEAKLLEEIY